MDADLSAILSVGFLAVAGAGLSITLLVRRDLVPVIRHASQLAGGGQIFLSAALGLGVMAFAIKLVIILTLSRFPDQTIAPLLPNPAQWDHHEDTTPSDSFINPSPPHPAPVWQSLPLSAPEPSDNPGNPAKIALGRKLFFDPALSANGRVSCASCHDLSAKAGADGRATSVGISGQPGRRNAPTVYNAAFQARLFWDGRAQSLEQQALGPLLNPDEMGMPSLEAVVEKISAIPDYRQAFADSFATRQPIRAEQIAMALAAFERTLITPDTPYDRFVQGDIQALTAQQKRGMWLFKSVGCQQCHSGPNFSGASLLGARSPYSAFLTHRAEAGRIWGLDQDKGRAAGNGKQGVWRIPSLRNVALTAPYFHNGAVQTLEDAVAVMAMTQRNAMVVGPDDRAPDHLDWDAERKTLVQSERKILSHSDIQDIAAFLRALSSDQLGKAPP